MTNEQAYAMAKRLTDNNDHQEAVLVIAKHFKCSSIANAVEGVIMIHEARGHMEPPMIDMMDRLRRELHDAVEAAHGPDVRKAVYCCF